MKNGVGGQQQNEVMKERAKNRVDDLQGIFCDLQSARKESRTNDVALLEEQVNQMLREWQSELNQPSPASSFQVIIGFVCFCWILCFVIAEKVVFSV